MRIIPVILAGGSGSRLWPLSRKEFPKQFLSLDGPHSLLQKTVLRAKACASDEMLILANEAHYFLCQEQLSGLHPSLQYILEPCPKNTAPAIALAAHHIQACYTDAVLLILPSDHWIADDAVLTAQLSHIANFVAQQSMIATLGIHPTSPKTGFGYIEAGDIIDEHLGVRQINQFCEKPNLELAEHFMTQSKMFWNSGLFVCRASTYLEALSQHASEIFEITQKAYKASHGQHDYVCVDKALFQSCPSESIDYAIMEKTNRAVVVPLQIQWNDLGSWSAVHETQPADFDGNVLTGNVLAEYSKDCLIRSDETLVTALGLEHQIIIATKDAILVADKRYSEQVKEIVASFKEAHQSLAESHTYSKRPWGTFEILAEGEGFKVKRLMLNPGAKISLQRHEHRAEHWVVVSGVAEIINGTAPFRLGVNQSTYIPPKTIHRLSNPGDVPLYVIEVQSGDYLGEDGITRFEDVYARETVLEAIHDEPDG